MQGIQTPIVQRHSHNHNNINVNVNDVNNTQIPPPSLVAEVDNRHLDLNPDHQYQYQYDYTQSHSHNHNPYGGAGVGVPITPNHKFSTLNVPSFQRNHSQGHTNNMNMNMNMDPSNMNITMGMGTGMGMGINMGMGMNLRRYNHNHNNIDVDDDDDDDDEEDEEMVRISEISKHQKQVEAQAQQNHDHNHNQQHKLHANAAPFTSPQALAVTALYPPNAHGHHPSRKTPGANMHRSAFEKRANAGAGLPVSFNTPTPSMPPRHIKTLNGNDGNNGPNSGAMASSRGRDGRDVAVYTPSVVALFKNKDLNTPGTKRDAFSPQTMQLTSNIDQLLNDYDDDGDDNGDDEKEEDGGAGTGIGGSGEGGGANSSLVSIISSPNSRATASVGSYSEKETAGFSLIHENVSFGGESYESTTNNNAALTCTGSGNGNAHTEDWFNSFTLDTSAGNGSGSGSGVGSSSGEHERSGEELFRPKQLASFQNQNKRIGSDVSTRSSNSSGSTSASAAATTSAPRKGGGAKGKGNAKARSLNFNANTSSPKLQHPRVTKTSVTAKATATNSNNSNTFSSILSPNRLSQPSSLKQTMAKGMNGGGQDPATIHRNQSTGNIYGTIPGQGSFGSNRSNGYQPQQQQYQGHGNGNGMQASLQNPYQQQPVVDNSGGLNYGFHSTGQVSPFFGHPTVSPVNFHIHSPSPQTIPSYADGGGMVHPHSYVNASPIGVPYEQTPPLTSNSSWPDQVYGNRGQGGSDWGPAPVSMNQMNHQPTVNNNRWDKPHSQYQHQHQHQHPQQHQHGRVQQQGQQQLMHQRPQQMQHLQQNRQNHQMQHQQQQQQQHHLHQHQHMQHNQQQMHQQHMHQDYNSRYDPSPPPYQNSHQQYSGQSWGNMEYNNGNGGKQNGKNRGNPHINMDTHNMNMNVNGNTSYHLSQKNTNLQKGSASSSQMKKPSHLHTHTDNSLELRGKSQHIATKGSRDIAEHHSHPKEGAFNNNGSIQAHHRERLSTKESKTKAPKQEKVLSDSSMKRMNKENQDESNGESTSKMTRGKKGNRKGNVEETMELTSEEKAAELKRGELVETPQVRSILKDFYRKFRSKEKESLEIAADFAESCIQDDKFPKNVHWRIVLELADLAKRANNFTRARDMYHRVCTLQPFASQGWLERSKLEEECGKLLSCSEILNEGLTYCPYNENLRTRAIKHEERMAYEFKTGDLQRARELLAPLKHNSIDKVWRTVLEGALMEARAGREVVARRVLKYLMKWVSWYGPLYLEAFRLERDCDRPIQALEVVERGLKEIPRYGPLWFGAFRICEGLDIANQDLHLPRTLGMIDRAIKSISRELTWKVQMEAAQAQERAAHIAIAKNPSISLNEMLEATRTHFAKTIFSCPENLCWKVWLAAGRMELSAGRFNEARRLFLKSYSVVPTKGRPSVLLECVRLEEFVGNMKLAKAILCKTRSEAKADWKVWLQSVSLEVRSGNRQLAIKLAQKGLMEHSGTGRLWATLVQLREPDGAEQQMKALKKALRAVPKSGEVWCEAARMHLNPFSPCFNLETASNHLEFATKFTPQYGDSFLETLRQVMIQSIIESFTPIHVENMKSAMDACSEKQMVEVVATSIREAAITVEDAAIDIDAIIENLDSRDLELRCSNADPNYGKLWFHSRLRPSDTARTVLKRAKQVIWNDLGHYTHIYVAAAMRLEAANHITNCIGEDDKLESSTLILPQLIDLMNINGKGIDIKLLEGISKADFVTGFVDVNHEVDLQTLSLFDRRKILFGSDLLLTWKPLN